MDEANSGRKHPPHHPFVERHNEPIIVFLTVCSKDRKPVLASADVMPVLENAWENAHSWLVGRYVFIRTMFISFARRAQFHQSRWSNWFATGKLWLQETGRAQVNIPFGNAIFGLLIWGEPRIMRRNGITFWKILFALDWLANLKIGPTTAN